MNLAEIKTEEFVTLEVLHPATGEKTGAEIKLKGMHTDAWQSEFQKQLALKEKREAKGITPKPAQSRAESARLYAAVTASWKGITGKDGKPLECSAEAAEALYEPEHMAWLRAQISDALLNHANSIKK